ncbi:hypothetical protein MLD52_19940 [Puniceicoccaceae bacterium K14]|nr:hypothetical protein [Puniceicoccaceae bacterium K14]
MIWLILYLGIGFIFYWRAVSKYSGDPDDLLIPLFFILEPIAWVMLLFWPLIIWVLKEDMKAKVQKRAIERKRAKFNKIESLESMVKIGAKGTALGIMLPSGIVEIEGNRYFAICEGAGSIEKGSHVVVMSSSMGTLKVRKLG